MAHKTFISYKYSESRDLRDRIITALGDDASYYMGETSDSPDLTDTSTENIKRKLTDMMYNTSVTIVILSPNILGSKWIDWEIEYCMKEISRKDRRSLTNGVVGVVAKINGSYDWLINKGVNCHGTNIITYKESKLYPIINKNHCNSNPPKWHCSDCKSYDYYNGSYISFIEEETFLSDPCFYVENAYEKSERSSEYSLTKTR